MTWIEQAKSFGYSYKKERHRHRFTLGDAVISFGPVRKELRVQFNGLESRITNVEVEELPVVFRLIAASIDNHDIENLVNVLLEEPLHPR